MCAQVLPPALANGLDGVIRGLSQDLNSCMRIFTTPMPFAYIVHLRSALLTSFLDTVLLVLTPAINNDFGQKGWINKTLSPKI